MNQSCTSYLECGGVRVKDGSTFANNAEILLYFVTFPELCSKIKLTQLSVVKWLPLKIKFVTTTLLFISNVKLVG